MRVDRCFRSGLFSGILLTGAVLVLLGPVCSLIVALLRSGGDVWMAAALNHRRLILLSDSVCFSGGVALTATVAGVLAALALQRWRVSGTLLGVLFPALIIVPPYIHAMSWSTCIHALNSWLISQDAARVMMTGLTGSTLAEFMAFLPLATGFALLAFRGIDGALVESARVQADELRTLIRVILPLAAPTLMAGAGLVFVMSLTDYSVPSLFSRNVYAMEIFAEFSATGRPASALLTAWPVIAIAVGVTTLSLSVWRRAATTPFQTAPVASNARGWPAWCLVIQDFGGLLLAAQSAISVITLACVAGSASRVWRSVLAAAGEVVNSLWISAAASLLCLVLGLAVARRLDRGGAASGWFWAMACLAFALPASLTGIGLVPAGALRGAMGPSIDYALPVIACVSRFLPIAAFAVYAQLRRTDRTLIDAGRVYQRNRLQRVLRVDVPLVMPALLVAGAVCFAMSLGELGATLIVVPPGVTTLTLRLYNLLHYGASEDVAALCLALTFLAFFGGLAVMTALRFRRHRGTYART